MIFDYYRVFYYVGKYKSVTLASKELFTSQPAVTRTIKNLEHELGCRLFVRSKRGMELTHEGEVLFEYVSASFYQLEKGESEVRKHTSEHEGYITIGATVTALDEFLFSYIKEFKKNHPKIKIKIVSESTNKTLAKLRNGVIDVAFITTPNQNFDDVDYCKICDFENVVIIGKAFSKFEYVKTTIESLKDVPFIAMNQKAQLREYTDSIFIQNSVLISPTIEVDNAGLIIPFVRNNIGFSIAPYSLAKNAVERNEIIVLPTKERLPNRQVVMATSKVLPQSSLAKSFVKEIKNNLKY